jgi:3-oxoacyl-[acyl-carrier protein] reductase
MDLYLAGQAAVVTAASKGLGKAAARQLAREGARVLMCSRSDLIEAAADEIRAETGAEALPVRADITRPEDIERLAQTAFDRFGQVDILIINAGGPPPGQFLSLTPADWEAAVQLTLMSAVRLCYAFLPHMVARGSGSIVASESFTVKHPLDNLILSNSIRMAVIGMLKTLANEVGPKGVRVNSINPGWTYTERVDQLMAARASAAGTTVEQEIARTIAAVPLGRMGTVEEYGRAIAWLASPAASYIHGQALIFDGGLSRMPL